MSATDMVVLTDEVRALDLALGALALVLGVVALVVVLRMRVRTRRSLRDVTHIADVGCTGTVVELAPLTPEQISLRRFTVRTRGYDTKEVDAFLRAVAAEYGQRLDEAESEVVALREAAATEPQAPAD